ncbi:MAG: DUF362 domain-containing protein [Coriobacteriia bacterium]|nr:DUF362 domain-containing protein [Coriobacteriia bacterium]
MSSKVAIIRCESYDESAVFDAVGRGLELIAGIAAFASLAEEILLKPNVLVGSAPGAAVTTHPAVFAAVARHLQAHGVHVKYGDSPGFGNPENAARKSGLGEPADRLSIPFAEFTEGRQISFPEGHLIKQFFFANGALDADGIISLPKFKTHGMARVTGAVKNQFGCIVGTRKGEFHVRMPDIDRFSQMLVDLNLALKPRLYIMDGITAMEGNGPRGGDPRQMNVILISADPVALDATMCRMMALDPALVGTNVYGQEFGLGTYEDVELLGDPIEPFIAEDYNVNRSSASTTGRGDAGPFARNMIVPKPYIVAELCTKCGTCVKVCPVEPKAVDWATSGGAKDGKPPVHTYSRCIRCYCCQEMCPERAIKVRTPLLGRLIHRG